VTLEEYIRADRESGRWLARLKRAVALVYTLRKYEGGAERREASS
jgi:hypothetical protein